MKNRGFTLVELLVVISIIGLLSSVVYASLQSAKAKARDARRMADLHQIQNAIILYASDNGGSAPVANSGPQWAQINNPCPKTSIYNSLVPQYISTIPEDPLSSMVPPNCIVSDGWWYYYGRQFKFNSSIYFTGNEQDYVICSKLEKPNLSFSNWQNNSWTLNYCVSS